MSEPGPDAAEQSTPRREFGRRALLFLSIGAVIGSGWLFVGLDSATRTGGSAIVAWLIAIAMIGILALVHAELGTLFPVDGGTARFPLYGFGRVTGFFSGWFAWISLLCVAPIETQAALRYAGNYIPWLVTRSHDAVTLTRPGQLVAAIVLAAFTGLNALGLKWFRETNSVIVAWKIAVPLIVALTLMIISFRWANFTEGGFFTHGSQGIAAAISSGGVIFSLVGFEQAVELGGETTDPQRNIPWAILGSVVVAGVVYLILQISFIGATPASALTGGWDKVSFNGIYGPYAGLAVGLGATFIAGLVYLDAVISPGGSALTYTATSSRLPYALAREGYLPRPLARLNTRGVPVLSLGLCYVAELLVIVIFPRWDSLLAFVTAAVVLVYATAPLALGVLRHTAPELDRPYRLPRARIMAPLAFTVANVILIWLGWSTLARLFLVVVAGAVLLGILALVRPGYRYTHQERRAAAWLVPYFAGLCLISALGPYGHGADVMDDWLAMLSVVALSAGIFPLAMWLGRTAHFRLPDHQRPIARWYHTLALTEEEEGVETGMEPSAPLGQGTDDPGAAAI